MTPADLRRLIEAAKASDDVTNWPAIDELSAALLDRAEDILALLEASEKLLEANESSNDEPLEANFRAAVRRMRGE